MGQNINIIYSLKQKKENKEQFLRRKDELVKKVGDTRESAFRSGVLKTMQALQVLIAEIAYLYDNAFSDFTPCSSKATRSSSLYKRGTPPPPT